MKRPAPAKINLSLRVLGKRADGFHEIETLMVPLTLADEVTARPANEPGIRLICSDPTLPTGPGNLAYRAAELFYARAALTPALELELTKRIPHGAGLGGGSSDAASVLLSLNEFHDTGLAESELAAWAAELGSDVPFFIYRRPALCRGRGEKIEPAGFSVNLPLLLIKPSFGVPTPWAYTRWKDSRGLPGVNYCPQKFAWGELVNDLERPVFEKFFPLAEIKAWLLEQEETMGALMSGSGSTIFAVLRNVEAGDALAERARGAFGEVWTCVCQTTS